MVKAPAPASAEDIHAAVAKATGVPVTAVAAVLSHLGLGTALANAARTGVTPGELRIAVGPLIG